MQLERAQAFAFATGLSEARVSNMLLTHYAGISFATSEHAAGRHVDSRWEWRFCPGSHLCPECLVENGGAWQLAWKLPWSFVCLRHCTLLLDTCPRCFEYLGSGLASYRADVPLLSRVPRPGYCSNRPERQVSSPGKRRWEARLCGQPLGELVGESLEPFSEPLDAQHVLNRALDGEAPPVGGHAVSSLEYFQDIRFLCALTLYAAGLDLLGDLAPVAVEAFVAHTGRPETGAVMVDKRTPAQALRQWHRMVPRSSALLAAIIPNGVRILAAPSLVDLRLALEPLIERVQTRAPVENFSSQFPLSVGLASALGRKESSRGRRELRPRQNSRVARGARPEFQQAGELE